MWEMLIEVNKPEKTVYKACNLGSSLLERDHEDNWHKGSLASGSGGTTMRIASDQVGSDTFSSSQET